jgi:multiple sugar transport system ATP-binding protein
MEKPDMDTVAIYLESLEKTFHTFRGSVQVLKKIDLTINKGEFFVLLGPSGCGKSTLLNLLAGLEKPSGGRLAFDNETIAHPDKGIFKSPFERDVAMVFQSYALYPHMTVAENIAFPLTNLTPVPSDQEIAQQVKETAVFLKIDHLLDRKPAELSGGQRQRVAIGRAIIRNPRVCLMDEPLSNLDAQLRMDMRAQLKDLQQKLGVTTVYVTHDQMEAMTLGHRIAILNNGTLQQVDTPIRVYEEPASEFVARFIGSPSMNLFPGTLTTVDGQCRLATPDHQIKLPHNIGEALQQAGHTTITLGVRPEHFEIVDPGEGHFDVRVHVTENLGSEFLLYSFLPAGRIVIKSPLPPNRDVTGLRMLPEKLHFFGPDGVRLS